MSSRNNLGQFTKSNEHKGENHLSWKGGIQKPKNDCIYLWDKKEGRIRRPRQVLQENGIKIPKGYVVYHIDNNKYNDDITNLKVISRAELMKINSNKKKNGK